MRHLARTVQLLQNCLIWTYITQIFAFHYFWTWPLSTHVKTWPSSCPAGSCVPGLGYPCPGESFRGFNWSFKESEDALGQGHLRRLCREEALWSWALARCVEKTCCFEGVYVASVLTISSCEEADASLLVTWREPLKGGLCSGSSSRVCPVLISL